MSTPTTDYGMSYEFGLDVNLGTVETPVWQQVRGISALDPQTTEVSEDGATYDDLGAPRPVKLSESWTLGGTVQQRRQPSGMFLPEVEKLLELAGPDAVGAAATGHFRWYDDPATGEPNPNLAFEGFATVQMNRQNTGNAQIGGWSFTLTGQGRRKQITNPMSGPAPAPTITSITPPGAGSGDLVTIRGAHFTGASAVTFDAIAAVDFTVVDAMTVVASLPVDDAGPVDVVVTTAAGASVAVVYTRAA